MAEPVRVSGAGNLALHALLLATLPVALLLACMRGYADGVLELLASPVTEGVRQTAGAVSAIVTVNLVLASYCIQSYRLERELDRQAKRD